MANMDMSADGGVSMGGIPLEVELALDEQFNAYLNAYAHAMYEDMEVELMNHELQRQYEMLSIMADEEYNG